MALPAGPGTLILSSQPNNLAFNQTQYSADTGTGGASPTYVLTYNGTTSNAFTITALQVGQILNFKAGHVSVANATVQIIGATTLGTFNIVTSGGVNIAAGQIAMGDMVSLMWNGTAFELISGAGTTNASNITSGTLAIANGGTAATTASAALANLGAAPLANPTFTGEASASAFIPTGGVSPGSTAGVFTDGSGTLQLNSNGGAAVALYNGGTAGLTLYSFNTYLAGNLIGQTGHRIYPETTIGSDNLVVEIAGYDFSGGFNPSRGAFILVSGAQSAQAGNLFLQAGVGASTAIYSPSGVLSLYVDPTGNSHIGLGLIHSITTRTTTYTLLTTDYYVRCNSSSAFAVTLPAATGSGQHYIIKSVGTGTVTVTAAGSDKIDGAGTKALTQYQSLEIIDGASANWDIIA